MWKVILFHGCIYLKLVDILNFPLKMTTNIIVNMCRTCLKTPANKHISDLQKGINEDNLNYLEVMVFCLDIKITEDSKITTNLCHNCYNKIILFYKFKALSLKNDYYLRSLQSGALLEGENKYVEENGVAQENLQENECGESSVEGFNTGSALGFVGTQIKEESVDSKIHEDKEDIDYEYLESESSESEEERKVKHSTVFDRFKKNAPKSKKRTTKKRDQTEDELQGPGICPECGVAVLDLKAHVMSHQPKDKRTLLQCKACPKAFLSRGGRRRHYKIVHLGLKSMCDICNKEVVHLEVHKLQVHNRKDLPYNCAACGRKFSSRALMNYHLATHTEERPFECNICHKKYHTKNRISTHIRQVHEREKRYQCEICQKAFFGKSWLVDHMRTHSTERTFQCSDCGKSYQTKQVFLHHCRIHKSIRKHQCQACDKTFLAACDLKMHMITHTKEKRYACQFCGKGFGRADSCRRHERGHQGQLAGD